MSEPRIQVVERAIDVLMTLTDGPATLTEVARATGLPKGTAYRVLGSLSYRGVVVKEVDNHYCLGPGFLRLGDVLAFGYNALTTLAEPALHTLWEQTSETVALHARIGAERICISEIPSSHAIRYSAALGVPVPLYVGSAGRILLAAMDEAPRERLIASFDLAPLTGATIVDRDQLIAQVRETAENGYTESLGERVGEARAISVPVDVGAEVIALSVLGPADRMDHDRRLAMLGEMREAAQAITAATAATAGMTSDGAGLIRSRDGR